MNAKHFFLILTTYFLNTSVLNATPNITKENIVIAKKTSRKNLKKNRKNIKSKFGKKSKKMKNKKRKMKNLKTKSKDFITGYHLGAGNGTFLNSGYHVSAGLGFMKKYALELEFENSAVNIEDDTSTLFKSMSIFHGGIRYSFYNSFNTKIFLQRESYTITYETLVSGSLLKLEYLQPVSYFGLTVGNTWKYSNFFVSIDWGGYLYPFYYEDPIITGLSDHTAFEINTQADIVGSTLIARTMMLKVTAGVAF